MTRKKYTFTRWWAHYKAYQRVAHQLGVWHVKHLFHDLDKPVMNLVFSNQFVKNWHRTHAAHHMESSHPDLVGAIVDWECSRYTKADAQLNARETLHKYYSNHKDFEKVLRILDRLGL